MKKSKIEQIIHQDTVLKQALSDPRVTRRDFLAFAGAMGLSTAIGSALWSGRALAAGPKRGGHMVSGLNGANTSDSLDPGLFMDTYMISVSRAFRDSLVNVAQDNSMEPALAESAGDEAEGRRPKIAATQLQQGIQPVQEGACDGDRA